MGRRAVDPIRAAAVCATALAVFFGWLAVGARGIGIAFLYAVPVGLAAWWGTRRWAALAVVGCTGLFVVGSLIQHIPHFGVALGIRLVALTGVAILVTLLRERLRRLEHSAEELEAIRAALAPSELPQLPHVDSAAAFIPSEYGVSGDFYLLTNGPGGSAVAIVGDVMGHGPRAARLATFLRARFAAFAASTSDPAELLKLANAALTERPSRRREIVTAACVKLEPDGGLSWAVAGHPPPLCLPELEELELEDTTFPLGAESDLDVRTATAAPAARTGVLIYTDGATDVRRGDSRLGLNGLAGLLKPLVQLPAGSMVSRIEQAILDWAREPVRDDLCLLVLKPK